ncbi:hypothetical protein [Nocardia iowensis]|uniref:Uncharacterized protein n=1 Tax=Nocardia iowensis TaxID=204891 RepID=A0ABX8RGX5_NOCIO|nr:hypothetical protein [Nocardia iowensis]QXN88844.1 hypothetical protein KV110_25045 [Nocardia iowensis]
MVAALAAGIGLIVAANGTPDAGAKPINPYVPCPQWQEMHPGWPCWGNFPEIEEPTAPTLLPTPLQPSIPTGPPSAPQAPPPAAALTPPPPSPAPNPCKAIIPIPGYLPPALPGHPDNPSCSLDQKAPKQPPKQPTKPPPTPRDPREPARPESCPVSPLSSEEVHWVVRNITGPLEAEDGSDDPLVARVIQRVNQLNSECHGTKEEIMETAWEEVRDDWYGRYRWRHINRDRKRTCYPADVDKDCEGLVAVCLPSKNSKRLPANMTPAQVGALEYQLLQYIKAGNELTNKNRGLPLDRNKLTGAEEDLAEDARDDQHSRFRSIYHPPTVNTVWYPSGKIVAGHLPDTVWSGNPNPAQEYWMPMDLSLNGSIGGQSRAYPEYYKVRAFVPGEWMDGVGCVPRADPPAGLLDAVPNTQAP